MDGTVRVGISGWTYAPWRGTFFPPRLAHHRELAYASRQLASIEINGTFYSLQRPSSYLHWREQTPDWFRFSVKAPRFITHLLRLRNCRTAVANFFASGVLRLGPKLGPLLWQLPPSFKYDAALIDEFLGLLPRTTRDASRMARHHDAHVREPWIRSEEDRRLRHALEIRHESFVNPAFYRILRKHGVALVTADTAGKWPLLIEKTADFSYARLHGDSALYVSGYTPKALAAWARRIRTWKKGGRDVYVYFDNDVKVRAPYDARALAALLKASPPAELAPPAPLRGARGLADAAPARPWLYASRGNRP